jgi:glycosyltransferase involved in cell wall biosynthesis
MFPSAQEPRFGAFVRDQVEDLRTLGIDTEVFSFDGRVSWTKYAEAARVVRRIVRERPFHLVHAHYGLSGAVALMQRRVPVVTTFHGSDFSGAIPWQTRVSRIVARYSSPIFVTAEGANRLRPGAPVIPAGVDVELFRPIDRDEARCELGWPVDARYVLFPSNPRTKLKRFDLFTETLAQVAAHVKNVRSLCLDGYTREQVALVLNAVDVTLMTSEWEGSPVTVRESLACKTPVVAVPVGDVPSVLAGLPGCAVVARDPAALSQAVIAAFEAGRSSALRIRAELQSRGRVAERVVQVYESVLSAQHC